MAEHDLNQEADQKMAERFPANDYMDRGKKKSENLPVKQDAAKPQKRKRPSDNDVQAPKKPSIGDRVADVFLDDTIRKNFIADWVFPGVDSIAQDILHRILLALFGDIPDKTRRRSSERNDDNGRLKYHRSSLDDDDRRPIRGSSQDAAGNYIRASKNPDVCFNDIEQAKKVLDNLNDDIENYGYARLKDFYLYIYDVTNGEINVATDFPTNSWGWKDLPREQDLIFRNGRYFELSMPRVVDIRK